MLAGATCFCKYHRALVEAHLYEANVLFTIFYIDRINTLLNITVTSKMGNICLIGKYSISWGSHDIIIWSWLKPSTSILTPFTCLWPTFDFKLPLNSIPSNQHPSSFVWPGIRIVIGSWYLRQEQSFPNTIKLFNAVFSTASIFEFANQTKTKYQLAEYRKWLSYLQGCQ
jgi:hypothetical protein